MDVDRVAVLLDIWTCETAFLENKIEVLLEKSNLRDIQAAYTINSLTLPLFMCSQLLNCYFEAYQHVINLEERFSLAQVITDIMHRRPCLDLEMEYFVQAYWQEVVCLQSHQQLIKLVLNAQVIVFFCFNILLILCINMECKKVNLRSCLLLVR